MYKGFKLGTVLFSLMIENRKIKILIVSYFVYELNFRNLEDDMEAGKGLCGEI